MKTNKIVYWTTTSLVSLFMLMSSGMYLSKSPELIKGFATLGFPLYFVMLLGTAKLLGALLLILPKTGFLKEWSYAGFAFTFVGAVWTHIATGTPFVAPLVLLIVLIVSYIFYLRVKKQPASVPATA